MLERFMARSAVMLFVFRSKGDEKEILLQKRCNTGYADGMWDCAAAGHVDANESMKMAAIREADEELGISIIPENIEFGTFTHKYTPKTNEVYYNAFFVVKRYDGVPYIREPEKCSDLQWFPISNLPDGLLPDRKQAIHNYLRHIPYDEMGWERR